MLTAEQLRDAIVVLQERGIEFRIAAKIDTATYDVLKELGYSMSLEHNAFHDIETSINFRQEKVS